MRFTVAFLGALGLLGGVTTAINTIELKGRHFIDSVTKKEFFIKGVDYQPGGAANVEKGGDPLTDADKCARDVFLFQQLGINTIRVYSVDPTQDHNECMTILAAAGIYLVLDVNTPLEHQHLNNEEPWTTYTSMYSEHIFSVMHVFSGYDNTLAFLAGNEVIFDPTSAKASPNYVKAVVRDMKAYITNQIHRRIPVGYSNADDLRFRTALAAYLECGDTGYIDFWGVNSYQWCGKNTFTGSGYDKLVEDYKDYSLPIFFTEYGCNEVRPRIWQEVDALYSEKMTGVFSGGLVYEFTQEPNDYGLVNITKDEDAVILKEFDSLGDAFEKTPKEPTIPSGSSNPTRPVDCPAASKLTGITANFTLPTTQGAEYIKSGVDKTKFVKGKFVTGPKFTTTHKITDSEGKEITEKTVKEVATYTQSDIPDGGIGINIGGGTGTGSDSASGSGSSSGDSTKKNGAGSAKSMTFGWSLGLITIGFAALL
ncbi:unnamed protein product [Tuber melanosporum]|jgi:hypothetical protein|uniref:1,3-beta-glucanosyltransferase n=1 Tax=Tuber melanosporum (strain Mel28) TaxID=656061 RepID=D5G4A6_TUBMM|nr:uncharacterized protein GSTUM_00004023001 [Tuber melanosporum]CAZ79349.1 unnamed protein product [Tuber melanosporum]